MLNNWNDKYRYANSHDQAGHGKNVEEDQRVDLVLALLHEKRVDVAGPKK